MVRTLRVAVIVGALAAPGVATQAQDAKPAPPPARSTERQSPPAASGSGGDYAVARPAPAARAETPRAETPRAVAPRAEAPRVSSPAPSTTSAAATSDSGRSRPSSGRESSGRDQSRQRSAPPPDRRGSGDGGDRAVARRGTGSRDGGTAYPTQATERDRGGRQSFGTATERRYPPHPGYGGGGHYPYYPHWNSWYYPYYPLSYGFFWDPWWGYGSPYGAYGYGYGGGYGSGFGYGYGGYGPYQGPSYQIYGGLRLKVKPQEAEVFVDGYFAGVVDDFDGAFQQLNLDVGPHRIELRANGYQPVSFEIRTQPDEKITYKTALKRVP